MRSSWGGVCRAIALAAVLAGVAGCELIANVADRRLNPLAPVPQISDASRAYNDRFLVIDLHADTLMWRRGLAESTDLGQVDLNRLRKGNVGLQVLTMPTRVPTKDDARLCTDANGSDPAPLLAMASSWPPAAWASPYQRALVQAKRLEDVSARTNPPYLTVIKSLEDLTAWLGKRFPASGRQDPDQLAALLGAEGAHAFSSDLGEEFETLYAKGLRLVGPMHHFTNVYGGSSEGCERPRLGLTERGKALVRTLFTRGMVVDMAHAAQPAVADAIAIATKFKRPLLVSHTGVRSWLEDNPQADVSAAHRQQAEYRAMSSDEIAGIAVTGGTVGIIYWEDQIGAAKVENVVGAITRAYCELKNSKIRGFHAVEDASEHISYGSDWDGAAKNAVGADNVAAITIGLCWAGFTQEQLANITGRNGCRVIAQSLSAGRLDYKAAKALCRFPQTLPSTRSCDVAGERPPPPC